MQSEDRKPGRPSKDTRADKEVRPRRMPLSGHRDLLSVANKDPNYVYRWVKDTNENGGRIERFRQAGYELVERGDHVIGELGAARKASDGGVVRIPESDGRDLFLMRIPREYYEQDRDEQERMIREQELSMIQPKQEELGQYGEIKLSERARVARPVGEE